MCYSTNVLLALEHVPLVRGGVVEEGGEEVRVGQWSSVATMQENLYHVTHRFVSRYILYHDTD